MQQNIGKYHNLTQALKTSLPPNMWWYSTNSITTGRFAHTQMKGHLVIARLSSAIFYALTWLLTGAKTCDHQQQTACRCCLPPCFGPFHVLALCSSHGGAQKWATLSQAITRCHCSVSVGKPVGTHQQVFVTCSHKVHATYNDFLTCKLASPRGGHVVHAVKPV